MCKHTSAARAFWGEGASLEGLATRSALVWLWRLSVFSTWASLLPILLSRLEGG